MNLKTKLKLDAVEALKSGDSVKKNILKVILGDVETEESRTGTSMTDDKIHNIIRKTIEANQDVLQWIYSDTIIHEIEILESYLPKVLTIKEITIALLNTHSIFEDILSAKSEGQAIGISMKHFKNLGLSVHPADIKIVVGKIKNDTKN